MDVAGGRSGPGDAIEDGVTLRTTSALDDESLERRQRRLLVLLWASTLLPLLAFGYLTWQSWTLGTQVQEAQDTLKREQGALAKVNEQKAAAIEQLTKLNADLKEQQRSTAHYRDFAGIKVRFYRESDRAIVQKALVDQGFKIDASLGTSPLINRERANTLAYGSLVSKEDLKDIAVALVKADFPLQRIAPATRQPDPKLIQIYASEVSDQRKCDVMTEAEIRAAEFEDGEICGGKSKR
jgi:hypothetical protein